MLHGILNVWEGVELEKLGRFGEFGALRVEKDLESL